MAAPRINWSTLLGQNQSLLRSNILRLLLLIIQVAGLHGVANPPCSKSIGAAGTLTQVLRLNDRRSTNWATDHAGKNEWNNFDWWLPSFTARHGILRLLLLSIQVAGLITRGCQSPLLEKYWRSRDLNPGLPFTWQTLYQLSYWPRRQKWMI